MKRSVELSSNGYSYKTTPKLTITEEMVERL